MKKDSNNRDIDLKENCIDNNIINIADFQSGGKIEVQDISFARMVFDPSYRSEVYDKFDETYVETDEEREIFESMRKRR